MFDFGPLAAQTDPDILGYFHITKQIKRIVLSGTPQKNYIFVARPGGGKTALLKWLEGGEHKRVVIAIRSDEARMIIDDDPTATTEDHRILMTAELFSGILMEISKKKILSRPLQIECDEFIRQEWREAFKDFFNERFEGVTLFGHGFSLRANDRRNYLQKIRNEKKVSKAIGLIGKVARVCMQNQKTGREKRS